MSSCTQIPSTVPSTSHGKQILNLFQSQKYVDCTFKIDSERIKCHKLILSSASPVFEAMFYGPLCKLSKTTKSTNRIFIDNDSNEDDDDDVIEISDTSPEIFKLMIEFIYCGEININKLELETLIELYYCSDKYLIETLIKLCLSRIRKKLDFKNILYTLDLCIQDGIESELFEIVTKFFQKYCLNNNSSSYEFIHKIDANYYHVSKDCIKFIINDIIDSDNNNKQDGGHQNNDSKKENNEQTTENNCNFSDGTTKNDNNEGKFVAICFIQYWCKNECKLLGLNETDYSKVLNDLKINDNYKIMENNSKNEKNTINLQNQIEKQLKNYNTFVHDGRFYLSKYIERQHYRSLRPIVVTEQCPEFSIRILVNQQISLIGFKMHSRILPRAEIYNSNNNNHNNNNNNSHVIVTRRQSQLFQQQQQYSTNQNTYTESFTLYIWASDCLLVHCEEINLPNVNYNCDLNVTLCRSIIFNTTSTYFVKICWHSSAYGAEYPLSLYSNEVNNIQFLDDNQEYFVNNENGTIFKGIRYTNEI